MSLKEKMKQQLGLSDADFEKPLPKPMPWSREFWEAAKKSQLVLKHCLDCGHIDHPPYLYCTKCGSHRSEWRQASGRSKLAAYAVNTYGVPASFVEDLPYVVAMVDLPEGPRMISNIVDCNHEDLKNGMDLEVVFHKVSEDLVLPKWRPVANSGGDRDK